MTILLLSFRSPESGDSDGGQGADVLNSDADGSKTVTPFFYLESYYISPVADLKILASP